MRLTRFSGMLVEGYQGNERAMVGAEYMLAIGNGIGTTK